MYCRWSPGFAVVLILLGIFALIVQEYAGRRNAFYYDLITVFLSTAGIMGIVMANRLYGNHLETSELDISDTLPLLAIAMCLTFLHLSFEVRTRYSWVAPVFSSAMYAAFTVPPGLSPEGFSKSVYNSVWLCVFTVGVSRVAKPVVNRVARSSALEREAGACGYNKIYYTCAQCLHGLHCYLRRGL